MRRLIYLFSAVVWSFAAMAQGHPTDILLKRDASYSDRKKVAKQLNLLEGNKPLSVREAISETCYGIDLCAGLTPQSEIDKFCAVESEQMGDFSEELDSGNCATKRFRQKNTCDENLSKQSVQSLGLLQQILGDYTQTYLSAISTDMHRFYGERYSIDVELFMNSELAWEEYKKHHPEETAIVEDMSTNSVALSQYTLGCYQKINSMLFSQDKLKITRNYNLISSVINTMEVFPLHKGMVNRGASLPTAVLKEHHKVGNIVCYNGFTSTSIHHESDLGHKPRNSFLEGKCTQRLYIKYEDNGAIAGRSIDRASGSKGENEVLFEPGACFRIDKVTPRTDTSGKEDPSICQEGESYNFEMTLVPAPKKMDLVKSLLSGV